MLEWIADAYQWFWMNTTGRPYTDIFRDEPWLFTIPAIVILAISARALPRKYWARGVILYLGLSIGLLGGHVFL